MMLSGFWVLLFLAGTALVWFLSLSSNISGSTESGMVFSTQHGDGSIMLLPISRKLKENVYKSTKNKRSGAGTVSLEDYHPIDPTPSSKASVKPGPIEHGSPLIPYIPKPMPPEPPKGGSGGGGFA